MKIEHTYKIYEDEATVFAEHIDTKIDGVSNHHDYAGRMIQSLRKKLDKAMLNKLTIEQLEAAKKLIEEVINEKQDTNF